MGFLDDMRKENERAKEFYAKRPPKERKQRSRNYHMAMIAVDALCAMLCLMSIVGIPLGFLFIYLIMKRYDKHLR